MSNRVFLIYFFKLFIEALSKNAASQRTPSKVLAEILEEAKAAKLGQLEKYHFDCDPDIQVESILSRGLNTFFRSHASAEAKVRSFDLNIDRDIEEVLQQFYKDFRVSELLSSLDIELDSGSLSHYNDKENPATFTSLQKRRDVLPKEGGSKKQGVEIVGLQAMGKIKDGLQKVISSPDIPDEEKVEIINKAASHVVDVFDARLKGITFEETPQQKTQTLQQKKGEIFSHRPKQEKAVQPPDLHEIAPWKSKEKSGPASKYLQDNYGYLLKRYNRELDRDLICLQDIKAHDKTLWRGLYSEAKKTGTKPSEYVASKSQRTKEAALDTDIGKLRKLESEAARQRQAMRRHGISLESLKNKP